MQSHNLQYAPARYVLHFFHFVKEQTSIKRQPKLTFQEVRDNDDVVMSDCSKHPCASPGGAGRDRTDDLRLAKPPLSQLSYSPVLLEQPKKAWWVWLDSNQRPPPYQDGALTD